MKGTGNRISKFSFLLLLIIIFFSISCEKNLAPVIDNIVANPTELEAGGQASLSVSASDPDGDPLIYLWEASGGEISSENYLNTATWTAPPESGAYYCTVSVNDGTEIVKDSVLVTISEDPVLSFDKDTLYFDIDRNRETFSISNLGTGLLDWSIETSTTDGGSWIKSVTPDNGSTAKENPQQVEVVIDRIGLAGGVYQGSLNISSDDMNKSVHIVMDVAELIVNPGQLNFGPGETELSLGLQNGGSGTLSYSITVNINWLSADPSTGNLTTQEEFISVQVDRTGLAPGTYNGQINIVSIAGDKTIPVQMLVQEGPILQVDPNFLDFGESESSMGFSIQNGGGGNLTWTISEDLNWLTVDPASGSTTSEEDDIQVAADRSVLSAGSYSGKIVVSSNGGNEEINVSIVVTQGPVLKINTDVLNFGPIVPTRSFFIQNDGGGTLNWTISEDIAWLTVAPADGSTGSTDAENIQVAVDRSQLNPGSYSGSIKVNSNGGDAEITVNMTVAQGPVLDVSVSELDFGSRLNSLEFIIDNTGGGTLEWSIDENIDWLDIEPVDGEVTTDAIDIQVSVDRTVVSPGDHEEIILVKSNGGDVEIKVKISIQASGEWLIFDDGSFEKHITTSSDYHFFLTQFDRPSDWKEFKITRVAISFSQTSGADNIELFCFSTQLVNRRYYPYQSLFGTASLDPESGWNEWKVDWTLDIDRFCVGYRQTQEKAPNLHIDTDTPQDRSYFVKSNNQGLPENSGNWAIRVFIIKSGGAPVPGRWLDITIQPGDKSSEGELKFNIENKKPL